MVVVMPFLMLMLYLSWIAVVFFFLRLFKGLLLLLIFSFLVIYVLAVVDMFCFLCCSGHTPFCLTFSFFLCYCCCCCYCGCQSSLFLVPFVHVRLLSRQKFCTYIRVGRSRSPLLASRHRQSPHITQYPLSQQHQHTHSLTHSLTTDTSNSSNSSISSISTTEFIHTCLCNTQTPSSGAT